MARGKHWKPRVLIPIALPLGGGSSLLSPWSLQVTQEPEEYDQGREGREGKSHLGHGTPCGRYLIEPGPALGIQCSLTLVFWHLCTSVSYHPIL